MAQFNMIFAELRTAVPRPPLVSLESTAYDPIDMPDEIKAIHSALAINTSSVSANDIERCLAEVISMLEKRKDDITTAVCDAMAAEQARMTAMAAEQAQMTALLAEQKAALAIQEAERAATFERLKQLEAKLNSPEAFTGPNAASQAPAPSPQEAGAAMFQPEVGRRAERGIVFELVGDDVPSKDEQKLHSTTAEPSDELIASVRSLITASAPQDKEVSIRNIFDIASQIYGYPGEMFGAVEFPKAISSHFNYAGGSSTRIDAGSDELSSRSLNVSNLTANRTLEEAKADLESAREFLKRGSLGI